MRRKRRPYHVRATYPDRIETVTVQAFDYIEAERLAEKACPCALSYRAVLAAEGKA